MEVKFFDTVDEALLKFAVIIAKAGGTWVYCKHKERDTYEIPGGHREPGESILAAAERELREETGASDYTIEPVCAYSVTGKNRVNDTGEKCSGCCSSPALPRSGKKNCTARWKRWSSLTNCRITGPIR